MIFSELNECDTCKQVFLTDDLLFINLTADKADKTQLVSRTITKTEKDSQIQFDELIFRRLLVKTRNLVKRFNRFLDCFIVTLVLGPRSPPESCVRIQNCIQIASWLGKIVGGTMGQSWSDLFYFSVVPQSILLERYQSQINQRQYMYIRKVSSWLLLCK